MPWIGNNDPMKVEEVFSNVKSNVDPDVLLKQTFQIVNTTISMLANSDEYRKKFLSKLVGMVQSEQKLQGKYYPNVKTPEDFKHAA